MTSKTLNKKKIKIKNGYENNKINNKIRYIRGK